MSEEIKKTSIWAIKTITDLEIIVQNSTFDDAIPIYQDDEVVAYVWKVLIDSVGEDIGIEGNFTSLFSMQIDDILSAILKNKYIRITSNNGCIAVISSPEFYKEITTVKVEQKPLFQPLLEELDIQVNQVITAPDGKQYIQKDILDRSIQQTVSVIIENNKLKETIGELELNSKHHSQLFDEAYYKNEKEYNSLQKEYNKLADKYNSFDSKYNDIADEYNRLEEEYNGLKKGYSKVTSKYNILQTEKNTLFKSASKIQHDNDKLNTMYKELTIKYSELFAKYEGTQKHNDMLQSSLRDSKAKCTEYYKKLEKQKEKKSIIKDIIGVIGNGMKMMPYLPKNIIGDYAKEKVIKKDTQTKIEHLETKIIQYSERQKETDAEIDILHNSRYNLVDNCAEVLMRKDREIEELIYRKTWYRRIFNIKRPKFNAITDVEVRNRYRMQLRASFE